MAQDTAVFARSSSSSSLSRAPTELATTLLTEHLGFTPIAVIDDIINAVNDLIYQASTSLESFVEEVLGDYADTKTIVSSSTSTGLGEKDQGIHAFETLLENLVDKNFDLFELYALRNTFYIPPELLGIGNKNEDTVSESRIVLRHHKGLDLSISDADGQRLDQEIAEARRKLKASRRLSVALNRGLSALDRRRGQLESVYHQLSFVHEMAQAAEVSPLLPPLSYLTSQLSALQTTLLSLHTSTSAARPSFPENLYPALHQKGYHANREAYLRRTTQALVEDREAADLALERARGVSGRTPRRSSLKGTSGGPGAGSATKGSAAAEAEPRKRPLGEEARLERIMKESAELGDLGRKGED